MKKKKKKKKLDMLAMQLKRQKSFFYVKNLISVITISSTESY